MTNISKEKGRIHTTIPSQVTLGRKDIGAVATAFAPTTPRRVQTELASGHLWTHLRRLKIKITYKY